ncbi:unnamed protein product [Clonostachys chloroleuca]|uniref:Uncharacterized protein n=1 Tax=Clonostachys chloroleuca TaxID=1926264 RepID=A0AA35QG59_9HYPO|nr:unnamed protein product [Clonostachys chloroleuca]
MRFSAFLAASAATLVVASYEESDDIALRSLTDIEERDELLGDPESLNSRSLSGVLPSSGEEHYSKRGYDGPKGHGGEAMMAPRDMEVATLGMHLEEEAGGILMAGEAMMAPRDMEVATLGMHLEEEAGGIRMAGEVLSFRDRKA